MVTIKRRSILDQGKKTDMMKALTVRQSQKSCLSKGFKQFKSIDRLGEKIRFTYKGEKTYKTYIGAVLTLIQTTILLTYIIYEIYTVINRIHPIESTTFEKIDFE